MLLMIFQIIKIIYTPSWHKFGGLNDRFSFCSFDSYKIYGNRFNETLEYSKNKKLHSETFLHDLLNKNNLILKDTSLRALRIRANNMINLDDKRFFDNLK